MEPRTRLGSHLVWGGSLVTPLVVGLLIYLTTRPTTLVLWTWLGWLGLTSPALAIRSALGPWVGSLPGVAIHSGPAGLWLFSTLLAVRVAWRNGSVRSERVWVAFALALAIGAEVAQAFGLLPGTFDILDLSTYFVATMLAMSVRTRRST